MNGFRFDLTHTFVRSNQIYSAQYLVRTTINKAFASYFEVAFYLSINLLQNWLTKCKNIPLLNQIIFSISNVLRHIVLKMIKITLLKGNPCFEYAIFVENAAYFKEFCR